MSRMSVTVLVPRSRATVISIGEPLGQSKYVSVECPCESEMTPVQDSVAAYRPSSTSFEHRLVRAASSCL